MVNVTVTISAESSTVKGSARSTETIFNLKHTGETPEEHREVIAEFKARVLHALDTLLADEDA